MDITKTLFGRFSKNNYLCAPYEPPVLLHYHPPLRHPGPSENEAEDGCGNCGQDPEFDLLI